MKLLIIAAIANLGLLPSLAAAATSPQKCAAAKNSTAGKYAACRHKAEKSLAVSGNLTKYSEAITNCEGKFAAAWQKAVDKAAEAGVTCDDEPLVAEDFKTQIDSTSDNIASALGGGGLADCGGDLSTCTADFGTCSGSLITCGSAYASCSDSLATCGSGTATPGDVLAGKTFSSASGIGVTGSALPRGNVTGAAGSLSMNILDGHYAGAKTCTASDGDLSAANIKSGVNLFGVAGTRTAGLPETGMAQCRPSGTCPGVPLGQDGDLKPGVARAGSFVDNGDGTITDTVTGLIWERFSDDGGIHDRDTTYNWYEGFNQKIAALNSTMFTGHNDWRMPTALEALTLKNFNGGSYSALSTPCTPGCTVLTCSCGSGNLWTSTTNLAEPISAYVVFASDFARLGSTLKASDYQHQFVRAVRGGL